MIDANNYEAWERIGDRIYRGDLKICDAINGEDDADYEANAKMITQAPRLLRCLQWATTFAEGAMDNNPAFQNDTFKAWVDECNSAIAAATHRKPARPEVLAHAEELFRVLNKCVEYIDDTKAADAMLTRIYTVLHKIERQKSVAARD